MSNPCSAYLNCAPESVDVTITQVTVTMPALGTVTMFHDYFTGADVVNTGGVLTLTLSHDPLSNDHVQMAMNSGVQGEAAAGTQHNFTVAGNVATLHFVPIAGDTFHFWYEGLV